VLSRGLWSFWGSTSGTQLWRHSRRRCRLRLGREEWRGGRSGGIFQLISRVNVRRLRDKVHKKWTRKTYVIWSESARSFPCRMESLSTLSFFIFLYPEAWLAPHGCVSGISARELRVNAFFSFSFSPLASSTLHVNAAGTSRIFL